MNEAIITISTLPSMPGRYIYSIVAPGVKLGLQDAGRDPATAAAKAMELANRHGSHGYSIFAPEKVLEHIPEHLRFKQSSVEQTA